MTAVLAGSVGALPFFMPAASGSGRRYCIFHLPAPGRTPRGAILYLHPFAEEMNQSRRMAALQARAFAAAGYSVLQIDLYGCGDSSGDFADASWPAWREDLALARAWLAERVAAPLSLWGLRLGALLALDAACAAPQGVERLILWHPVLKGRAHLDQFLRLRVASAMLAGGAAAPARAELARGASVEVAGYRLSAQLAAAIDALDGAALAPAMPVHWFDLAGADGAPAPAAARLAAAWRGAGVALNLHAVPGRPFWGGGEIVECPALLAATGTQCP